MLKLKTVSCRTLFTAQRWRTTAGFGLRLRIDARTALDRVSFKVAGRAAAAPGQEAARSASCACSSPARASRKRFPLKLAKKGRGKLLRQGAGKPRSATSAAASRCAACPRGSAVAELTIYRVKKLDGATKRRRFKLKARVMRAGSTGGLSLSVRPRAPRLARAHASAPGRRELRGRRRGEQQPGRRIAGEGEPEAAAREGRDQRQVERLMGGDGEGVRAGQRQPDEEHAQRERRHRARPGSRPSTNGPASRASPTSKLESGVDGEGDGSVSRAIRVAGHISRSRCL